MKTTHISFFIVLVFFLISSPVSASESISFDTANGQYTTTTSTNLSITIAEPNEMLLCFTADNEVANTDTAAFNGTSMNVLTNVATNHGYFKLWSFYLANPSVGTHNVYFTRTTATGGGSNWWVHCAAYKNASLLTPEAVNTLADVSGTNHTATVTTLSDNAWTVLYATADAGSLASSTGSTLRGSILNTASGLFDSNGPISPATTTNMSFSTGNGEATGIIVSLAPHPSIATDYVNQGYTTATTTSLSMTIAEPNEMLLCFTADNEKDNTDTAAFNGVSMNTLTSIVSTDGYFRAWAFYLANPSTGTHNVAFTRTTAVGGGSNWWTHCASYKQAGVPESYSVSADSTGTTHTGIIDTLSNNAWTVMYALANAGNLSSSTGSTLRGSILNTASGLFDSNGPVPVATTTLMSVYTGNGSATKIILSLPQSP